MESVSLTSWIALSIGFLHALEPGHGKTALFTFLASGKKTWREGLVISLSSALTHSAAVFIIAFVSHFVFHHGSVKDKIHEISGILSFISGSIIFLLGIWVIIKARKGEDLHENCCGHHHDSHQEIPKIKLSRSGFISSLLIGFATGVIPCPTVIVAYLSGVSTGNSFLGIQSVALFALGMFLALMSLVIFFNFGGQKVMEKIKDTKLSLVNWGHIQGSLFLVIGLITAFLH